MKNRMKFVERHIVYFTASIPIYDDTGEFLEYGYAKVFAVNARLALKKILADNPNITEKDVYWIEI